MRVTVLDDPVIPPLSPLPPRFSITSKLKQLLDQFEAREKVGVVIPYH